MLNLSIIGNIGAAPRLVESTGHRPFYTLPVAHSERYTDKSGAEVNRTIWVNVIINWDCSRVLPYLVKGVKIFAEGNIKLRAWKANDGSLQASCDIIANSLELCGGPRPETNTNEQQPDECPY